MVVTGFFVLCVFPCAIRVKLFWLLLHLLYIDTLYIFEIRMSQGLKFCPSMFVLNAQLAPAGTNYGHKNLTMAGIWARDLWTMNRTFMLLMCFSPLSHWVSLPSLHRKKNKKFRSMNSFKQCICEIGSNLHERDVRDHHHHHHHIWLAPLQLCILEL